MIGILLDKVFRGHGHARNLFLFVWWDPGGGDVGHEQARSIKRKFTEQLHAWHTEMMSN